MSIEDKTTDRVAPAGYVLTAPPRDPIVGVVVSVLLFLLMLFGGVPDGFSSEDMTLAVESTAGGSTVLFGIATAVWHRRVKSGNRLR